MEKRINLFEKATDGLKPIFAMGTYLKKASIEKSLHELIVFRVSQINSCAFCLDMHSKDARAAGETEQRLYGLSAWRETPYYTDRERAALAWAEAITVAKVSDEVYAKVSGHFTEEELIDLTLIATNINTWNRLQSAFPVKAGSYTVGQFG
ncbi:AhpD family alkylhydroperoxidase [Algoriphagus sp. 4150]|uniref:carboxymuconolactone decarboxylase family protein n=1 Tax=Algoriphagus sp. 4150 TaxID=2817756 RepID=UPI002855C0E7|nr:carboxymuconolactone decarboxylase family protein [Algoriphagus sp. 4150]MDR7129992.1 AhpD family alkylhydroperoxidase [Algoriphagus sp. 4150]